MDLHNKQKNYINFMNTLTLIKSLMVEQFELELVNLTPDTRLEDLGLDSLSVIEFTFKLEDELNIKFSDEQFDLKTIQDIVNSVDKLIASH